MEPITKIANELGLNEDHLIPYGRHKAKISLEALKKPDDYRGKLVVVAAGAACWLGGSRDESDWISLTE